MNQWDYYEYKISEHWLPAMVNGDFSGMSTDECADYRTFERQAFDTAHENGFTVGHWAPVDFSCDDWGLCDISGLYAMRCIVRLMVYREGAARAVSN